MINTTAAIISECVCNHLGLRLKYIKIQRVSTDGTRRANPQSRSDIKGTGASSRPAPSGLESVRPPWQELISDLCTRAPDAARRAGGPRGLLWVQFHLVSPLQRREEQQPSRLREPECKSVSFPSAGQRQSAAECRVTSIPSSLVSSHLLHTSLPPLQSQSSFDFFPPRQKVQFSTERQRGRGDSRQELEEKQQEAERAKEQVRRWKKRERKRETARHGETAERGGFKPARYNHRPTNARQRVSNSRQHRHVNA